MVLSEKQQTFTDEAEVEAKPVTKKKGRTKDPSDPLANLTAKGMVEVILKSNIETQEVDQTVRATMLEATDKMDELINITAGFIQKLDDMQFGGMGESHPVDVSGVQEYVTSREVFNNYMKQITRRDGEIADKKFMNLMEKMCLYREDYGKLCRDMRKNLRNLSAEDVLSSFEAYLVDMENMLTDAGVVIGRYGSDDDKVDVMHQRIVGVVQTRDQSKNGVVAERIADGYEYEGRAILKEKVNVYKITEEPEKKPETGFREILG